VVEQEFHPNLHVVSVDDVVVIEHQIDDLWGIAEFVHDGRPDGAD